MPLPTPRKGESKNNFLGRFMRNEEAKQDFPGNQQRVAVALSQWDKAKKKGPK